MSNTVVVNVRCNCGPEIAAERFLQRKRHQGHLDTGASYGEVLARFRKLSRLGPLGIEPRIDVDTSQDPNLATWPEIFAPYSHAASHVVDGTSDGIPRGSLRCFFLNLGVQLPGSDFLRTDEGEFEKKFQFSYTPGGPSTQIFSYPGSRDPLASE
jgi:hypothetical protein